MTPGDKELLLKDLSARLPYGVKLQKTYDPTVNVELYSINTNNDTIKFYTYKGESLTICDTGNIERFGNLRFKPYLFPLSSMTVGQGKEFAATLKYLPAEQIDIWTLDTYDWCNKNNFDYRGLIPMGLANDATGLNIY